MPRGWPAPPTDRRRGEHGGVTAETALVLPLLVAVTLVMVWFLTVGLAQVRVTDAAREAARALARGEPVATAGRLVEQVSPGATLTVTSRSGRVIVTVRQRLHAPGGVLGDLPAATATAEAVALTEAPG